MAAEEPKIASVQPAGLKIKYKLSKPAPKEAEAEEIEEKEEELGDEPILSPNSDTTKKILSYLKNKAPT